MKAITTLGLASKETKGDTLNSTQVDPLGEKIFINGVPHRTAPSNVANRIPVVDFT